MCVAIIADDLTGACDTAVKMRSENIDTMMLFSVPDKIICEFPQIFALQTGSRALDEQQAYEKIRNIISQLKKIGIRKFYKKIDSMYRGNVAAEIGAMMDALMPELVILAPAAPLNDRKILNGTLVVQNNPAAEVPVLKKICNGIGRQYATITIPTIKAGVTAVQTAIEREYEKGTQIILMDSETQQDLETIAEACSRLKYDFLPVGTSGFILPLKKYWHLESSTNNIPPILMHKANVQAKMLNLCEQKRLEVARSLAANPKLIMLDEVMAGLNPAEVTQVMEVIMNIRSMGVTIIVIEHIMQAIMNISDLITVISCGKKIAEGTPQEVANDKEVISAYLGSDYVI